MDSGVGTTVNGIAALTDFAPEAVVFDCDGLLLDTESLWYDTQREVIARHNIQLDEEQEERLIGASLSVVGEVFAEASGLSYTQLTEEVREGFLKLLSGPPSLMPGALEIVQLVSARVPVAVASNSWRETLQDKLEKADLYKYMDHLEAADTVANPKPAPDMYLAACRALGADPTRSLAFEDSQTGACAAKGAGMRLIGVNAQPPQGMPADVVLPSLDDPALRAWIASWPTTKGSRK
ncbi:HAD family phosphatase [Dermabacteraceae bacterium TAE3-ERU5]|nr:HAD family phosphatase [Dermabacteraceae bacterium TAE3-ERU5]